MDHIHYMRRALELAQKGAGFVNPNPMVGAVIVKDSRIIGEGYHHAYGQAHAEVEAMRHATDTLEGASIYVTLEPCSHFGKTPPCAQAIVQAGFKEVYVAMTDPNPLVSGKGIAMIQDAGIKVHTGILEEEAKYLNRYFIKHIQSKMPYVVLKSAMSLDGKTATSTGHSQWISGTQSRTYVHQLRHELSAIMVGIGTLLKDNPQLNVRLDQTEVAQPVKVIVDSHLNTPLDARIWNDGQVIIGISQAAPLAKHQTYIDKGADLIIAGKEQVDLPLLLQVLGQKGINSILLEGGVTLNASFIKEGLVDELLTFIAPKLIGNNAAPGILANIGVEHMASAVPLYGNTPHVIGEDIMIQSFTKEAYVYRHC